ncbi:MAG: TolC family protein [Gemmatimonadaceae bacterium]
MPGTHAPSHIVLRRLILECLLLGCALLPARIVAQEPTRGPSTSPLTLEEAIDLARASNAQLPVALLDSTIAQAELREARASRWPRLSLESSANFGGPLAYTTSQGLLQIVGSDTLFSGGLRRANLRAARYRIQFAGAGYRIAQKDVDLDVRLRFAEALRAEEGIAIRTQGIERLRSYLAHIQARQAAGQPVGSDVLTAQVRLGREEATLADSRRALDEARFELNDLMGRDPRSSLTLVELPTPSPPISVADSPWLASPEMRRAALNNLITQAGFAATLSERRPQLSMSANLGVIPTFSSTNPGTGPFSGSGLGGALMFSLSWPLLDAGVFRSRLERANLLTQQARGAAAVVRRQSRLSWQLADVQRTRVYEQVQIWAGNVPLARDASLQMESMYNGGAATALEVLDAYAAWVDANESYADAVLRFRQAEAAALRWGTP